MRPELTFKMEVKAVDDVEREKRDQGGGKEEEVDATGVTSMLLLAARNRRRWKSLRNAAKSRQTAEKSAPGGAERRYRTPRCRLTALYKCTGVALVLNMSGQGHSSSVELAAVS